MTTTTTAERTAVLLPAGTWDIDPSHSRVEFSVRHLMVSKVKGHFGRFLGTITVGDDPLAAAVEATIDVASVDTNDPQRDTHLRSADFLDVERHPSATFVSRRVRPAGEEFLVSGDLTLHGVTRPVDLRLEFNGVGEDPYGGTRAGFSATAEVNRRDFGIDISMPLANGGVVVGDKITLTLEIQAVARAAS
ncbi:MAG TPA: YceI family protein [Acidimicrobiales bacterium]|nr:YceI family protein [Acidimicrobiales bacterium]